MALMRNRVHRQPFQGHSQRWHKEQRARQSDSRDPLIKQLYDCAAWKALRAQVLDEAQHRCEVPGCAATARIVDHRIPHRGEPDLFFDRANLQAMCKVCHDTKTAKHDGGFGRARTPHA